MDLFQVLVKPADWKIQICRKAVKIVKNAVIEIGCIKKVVIK